MHFKSISYGFHLALTFVGKCIAFVVGCAFTIGITSVFGATSTITTVITPGSVALTAPGALTLAPVSSSSSAQNVNGTLGQILLDDLRGYVAGYYITMQSSNFVGSHGTIPSSNISASLASQSVATVAGYTNTGITIPDTAGTIGAGYVSLAAPVTVLDRTLAGENIFGTYAVTPALRVQIPAYTPADTYAGTITFTLMENTLPTCTAGSTAACIVQ